MGINDTEDTIPYNEEEVAALYPNPQLDANEEFIEYFIKVSEKFLSYILSLFNK